MSNVTRSVQFKINELYNDDSVRIGYGHISVTLWEDGDVEVTLDHVATPSDKISTARWADAVSNAVHNLVSQSSNEPFEFSISDREFVATRSSALAISQVGPTTPELTAFAAN